MIAINLSSPGFGYHTLICIRHCLMILSCGAFMMPLSGWGDDSFLLQLETDAKRQATVLVAPTWPIDPHQLDSSERLPLGFQLPELETILREQAITIWVFYERLNPQQRQQVFEAYRRDGRLNAIREQILRLLAND